MSAKSWFLPLMLGFALISAPTDGQQSPAEREVRTRVEALLADLGALRVDRLADYFTPDAVIIVARRTPEGQVNSVTTAERWIAGMTEGGGRSPFRERLSNVQVTVDDNQLAYLRADFEIVREGVVVSHGVDVFTLLRTGDGWKTAALAYTSIPGPLEVSLPPEVIEEPPPG